MNRSMSALMVRVWGAVCLSFAVVDDEAVVKAVVQRAFTAYKAGDVETLTSAFSPDASLFFLDGSLRIKGVSRQRIEDAYDAGIKSNLELKHLLEVTVYDTTAVTTAEVGGTIALGGTVLEGPWRLSLVLRHREGSN